MELSLPRLDSIDVAAAPPAGLLVGPESRRNEGDGFRLGGANIEAAALDAGRRAMGWATVARAARSEPWLVDCASVFWEALPASRLAPRAACEG